MGNRIQVSRPLFAQFSNRVFFSRLRSNCKVFFYRRYEHSSGIVQLQLEQDSGKSFHDATCNKSLIDLNRCGIGLMEIVFEPDLSTGEEAASLVRELVFLLKAVGSCNCNMEDGALRVDANVSVRRAGDDRLGTRTEVKNLNSLRFVQQAIEAEICRQVELVDSRGVVENETRGWDADSRRTVAMRDKEVKQDYRFMPEPNLPPLRLSEGPSGNPNIVDVKRIRESLPRMPEEERKILMEDFGLDILFTTRFLDEPDKHDYFKKVMELDRNHSVSSARYILSDLIYLRKKYSREELTDMRIQPTHVLEAAKLRDQDLLGVNMISKGLELVESSDEYIGKTLNDIVENEGWMTSSRSREVLDKIIQEGVDNHKKLVGKYVRGNSKGFTTILKNILKCHPDTDVILLKKLLLEKLEKMKLEAQK